MKDRPLLRWMVEPCECLAWQSVALPAAQPSSKRDMAISMHGADFGYARYDA